jgi:hypothetical protein
MRELKFLIVCPKSQDWMAKLCVASIRYFYPENEIYIIKDNALGKFSIDEMIKYWSVREIKYDTDVFGMSGAKMFFYADPVQEDAHYLVLDSDIVLLGRIPFGEDDFDVAISVEYKEDPRQQELKDLYFDVDQISTLGYRYPGYFFNAGQFVCRRGFLHHRREDLARYFDFDHFPRWKRLDILPRYDQSWINMYLPMMEEQGNLKIAKRDFMIWTGWEDVNKWTLDDIKNRKVPYLLHYAGAYRNQYLRKMIRPDILRFFQKYYYSRIPGGKWKLLIGDKYFGVAYYYRWALNKIRGK